MTHLGLDGKSYPVGRLSREERNPARWLAHELVCRDGMSLRRAREVMAGFVVRRSIGIIARDLEGFECPHCADVNT
jgi:hypothetical protein